MATRRITKGGQNILTKEPEQSRGSSAEEKQRVVGKPKDASAGGQTVSKSVIAKLLFYTFAMITGPISAYYYSNTKLFPGESTTAAAIAAVVANLIVLGYIISAIMEDKTEQEEEKKSQ